MTCSCGPSSTAWSRPTCAGSGASTAGPSGWRPPTCSAEYDEVTALSAPGAYDPAWILGAAADLLEEDPEALAPAARRVAAGRRRRRPGAHLRRRAAAARPSSSPGTDVVLLGDPDSAVQTFRGADPRHLSRRLDRPRPAARRPPSRSTLARCPPHTGCRRPWSRRRRRVAPKIGALGGGRQRAPAPVGAGGGVEVLLLRAVEPGGRHVAARLRAAAPARRRRLVRHGRHRARPGPHGHAAPGAHGRRRAGAPAARPTCPCATRWRCVRCWRCSTRCWSWPRASRRGARRRRSPSTRCSRRRGRRRGRRCAGCAGRCAGASSTSGGGRTSDELLAEALARAPATCSSSGPRPTRRAAWPHDRRGGTAARRGVGDAAAAAARWEPGVSAESVLWAMWAATGLASDWQATALAGGGGAARADRDLDAVVGLFDAAAQVRRPAPAGGARGVPHAHRGPGHPRRHPRRAVPGRRVGDACSTPQAAAGRQWQLVVVAGVQEGVWPDLRLRGSLLGSEAAGRPSSRAGPTTFRAAQAAVRYDETRSVPRRADPGHGAGARHRGAQRRRAAVGLPRRRRPRAGDGSSTTASRDFDRGRPHAHPAGRRGAAAAPPAGLDDATGAGAPRPRRWPGWPEPGSPGPTPSSGGCMRELSDDRPLRDRRPAGAGLAQPRWRTSATAGCAGCSRRSAATGPAVGRGRHRHAGARHRRTSSATPDAETLVAEVDARWGRLGLPAGWVSDRKRQEARDMTARLAAYFDLAQDKGWVKVGAEVDMRVVLGRAEVSGRVDRLERLPDGRPAGGRLQDRQQQAPSKADLPSHPQLGRLPAGRRARGLRPSHGADVGGAPRCSSSARPPPARASPSRSSRRCATSDDPAWAAELVSQTAEGMSGRDVPARPRRLVHDVPGADLVPGLARGAGAVMARADPAVSAADIAAALGQPPPTAQQVRGHRGAPRPLLVVAGAGSGKTETMAGRVVWLVANGCVEPDQVLGLTFTRKAATELAERIGSPAAAGSPRARLWTPEHRRRPRPAPRRSAAPPPSRPTTRMPAGWCASTPCGSATSPESRLLSEAAAWQYA